jgi:hypothetical protein
MTVTYRIFGEVYKGGAEGKQTAKPSELPKLEALLEGRVRQLDLS